MFKEKKQNTNCVAVLVLEGHEFDGLVNITHHIKHLNKLRHSQ